MYWSKTVFVLPASFSFSFLKICSLSVEVLKDNSSWNTFGSIKNKEAFCSTISLNSSKIIKSISEDLILIHKKHDCIKFFHFMHQGGSIKLIFHNMCTSYHYLLVAHHYCLSRGKLCLRFYWSFSAIPMTWVGH